MLALLTLAALTDLRPPNLANCAMQTATEVSVEQLGARPKKYLGRCVTVSGPTRIYRMYSGVEGVYLSQQLGRDGYVPLRNQRHRIGLYFGAGEKEDAQPAHPEELVDGPFRFTRVTGVADSCERMAQALPRGGVESVDPETGQTMITITMLGGYCPYDPGAVVWVTAVSVDPASRYERLTGEKNREIYGSLVRVGPSWRHYRHLRRLGSAIRHAIRAGDRAALSKLYGKFGVGSEALRFLLEDPHSPFAELRTAKRQLPFVILAQEWDQEGIPANDRRTKDALICFCRSGDCSGLWPIAAIDAGPDPDHPFACIDVSEDSTGAVFLHELSHRGPSAPLQEPARR